MICGACSAVGVTRNTASRPGWSRSAAYLFFFSSRRRHTRDWRDWSSDVCSSDLNAMNSSPHPNEASLAPSGKFMLKKWRSEERRVGKSVDLGGRRIIKKKKEHNRHEKPASGLDSIDSESIIYCILKR